jgi:GDP-L-fucose synthase
MMQIRDKRIVVTGGAGFLGRHIVNQLYEMGCTTVFAPRRSDYDLTMQTEVGRLFRELRPQVVIHAAAVVGGIGANRDNPGRFLYENAMMGLLVIDAARRYECEKVTVLGTICAYPKYTPVPFSEEDLWLGYPEETNAPYGMAKKLLLVQCQAYRQQYGLNSIYLLPVNLYGPGDNFDLSSSHVIPALIRKCLEAEGRDIEGWGDGTPSREFLYVGDAADAIVKATIHYDSPEPVNIGSGQEITIRDLLQKVAAATGFRGRITWDASKPNGQPRRCLNVERAAEFGFRATTTLDAGLRETVEWYQKVHRPAAVAAR